MIEWILYTKVSYLKKFDKAITGPLNRIALMVNWTSKSKLSYTYTQINMVEQCSVGPIDIDEIDNNIQRTEKQAHKIGWWNNKVSSLHSV